MINFFKTNKRDNKSFTATLNIKSKSLKMIYNDFLKIKHRTVLIQKNSSFKLYVDNYYIYIVNDKSEKITKYIRKYEN